MKRGCMGHYFDIRDIFKIIELKQKSYEEGYEKGRQEEISKTEDKLKMMHCNCHKEYDTNQFIWCSHCEDELDRLEKENIKLKEEVESLKVGKITYKRLICKNCNLEILRHYFDEKSNQQFVHIENGELCNYKTCKHRNICLCNSTRQMAMLKEDVVKQKEVSK